MDINGEGEKRVNFKYTEMPIECQCKIETADKGFWGSCGNLDVATWNPKAMGNL